VPEDVLRETKGRNPTKARPRTERLFCEEEDGMQEEEYPPSLHSVPKDWDRKEAKKSRKKRTKGR